MRSLLNFLLRYNFFILFLLLEIIALALVVQFNAYPKASFINSSSKTVGKVYASLYRVNQYFNLKNENQILLHELAYYRQNSFNSLKDNQSKHITINDTLYKQQYIYIPAQVVNNSVNKQNNHITINKGFNQGIKPQMGVVSALGAVGIVREVSSNYASVISILNQNIKISATHKSSGYFGSLEWDGISRDFALLTDLPNHVTLNQGDTIITSGYSTMFPKGVLIGFVDNDDDEQTGEFLVVRVRLSVDFGNLANVMVINNLMATEQLNLEQSTAHD